MRLIVVLVALIAAACAAPAPVEDTPWSPRAPWSPGLPGATATATPVQMLRVVTLNLQTDLLGSDDDARMDIVAAELAALAPDFVAFQEVYESATQDNRAMLLADALGAEWFWTATHDTDLYEEGPAILSAWPVTWSGAVTLPHPDLLVVNRATVGVIAATPGGEVAFFGTHLTTHSDADQKADQALASHEFMTANGDALPLVFAGDMNAEPDALAMQFLRGEANHEGVTGLYGDAWMATRPGETGYTFPAEGPDRRIDYIYAAGWVPVHCERLFADIQGLRPSDHLGVMCELRR